MGNLPTGCDVSAAVADVSNKLREIAGPKPLKEQIRRAQKRLGDRWRDKAAPNRIRHLLALEQKPSLQQEREIIAAHARYCAEQIEANRREDRRLAAEIIGFLEIAQRSDPEFFGPEIERLGEVLDRLRGPMRRNG